LLFVVVAAAAAAVVVVVDPPGIGVCGTYRLFPGMTQEKILYHSWVSGTHGSDDE
jgi:hypothetical protein